MVSKASRGVSCSWCWISGLGFPMWCLNSSFSLERIPKLMMSAPSVMSSSGSLQGMWVPTRLLLFPSYPSQSVLLFFFFFFIFFIVEESFCILQVFLWENCSTSTYNFGVFMGEGELRIFLLHHLYPVFYKSLF